MSALAELVVRRPSHVVAAWLVLTLAGLTLAVGLGDKLANRGYTVPGSDSEAARSIGERYLPGGDGTRVHIAVTADHRARAELARAARRAAAALRGEPDVARVGAPRVARDGRAAVVPVVIDLPAPDAEKRVHDLQEIVDRASPGATVLGAVAAYDRYTTIAREDLARVDKFSLPVTLLVLMFAFLSLVAAAVPILSAAVTLSITFGGLYLLTQATDMSVFATNTAVVLGIALSIDYALFMVVRYREFLGDGASAADAIRRSIATTGRTVAISGLTIGFSLAALLVVGIGMFSSLALGAMLAAFAATITSLTLVPAILVLLDTRIDVLSLKRAARAASEARLWHRLGDVVVRHRIAAAALSTLALLAMSAPLLATDIAVHSISVLPRDDAVRTQSERVAASFGGGATAPTEIVTRSPRAAVAAVRRVEGVEAVAPPVRGRSGWARVDVALAVGPDSERSESAVDDLRAAIADARLQDTHVGGQTAMGVDLKRRIDARTPLVVGIALLAAAIALAFGLRSILVPVKAVLTTLLSVGASLGIVTLLFQLLGDQSALAEFVPLLVFATVFGLSIDYEVFLVSRVRAEYLASGDNDAAIRTALVKTGRSITLAATVMVTVFLLFAASSLVTFQELGIALAVAVLIDATLVRGVLVPATMSLLGHLNWWFPSRATVQGAERTGTRPT
jgi:uncharacterized membrane protein YdfJ with MMPL/SSD domain